MKLVYTLGAAALTGLVIAQEETSSEVMPMEGEEMMEEPWWKFLEDYGLDVDEQRTVFKMDDPKIYFVNQHDGKKMNLRTPWYTRKYEIKDKDSATSEVHEFHFKETVPKCKIVNSIDFKTGIYNKNDKVIDENCMDNDPKKCEIKIPVGKQNKWDFKGEHKNENGKYKVSEKNNYVHDLEGYPMQIAYENGWDFAMKDAAGMLEMMEMMPSEMPPMDDVMDTSEPETEPEPESEPEDGEMMTPWYSNGFNKFNVKMAFADMENPMTGMMEKHWKSSEWDFFHYANHTGTSIVDLKMFGTTEFEEFTYDNATMSATAKYSYMQDSNQNWSQTGMNIQNFENLDNCMALMGMIMEGNWEDFFMGSFEDRPCKWSSVVEGTAEWMDMETMEEMSDMYRHGIAVSLTSFMHWNISYLDGMIVSTEDVWMPLFGISTHMNDEGETERTVAVQGEDMITINCDKLMAHQMEMQDKWARKFFMVYKNIEHMQMEMMMMDWADEEVVGNFVSKMWNMDYVISAVGNMEQEALQTWREMECAYPHYEMMSMEMGLTFHEPLQHMCYEQKSYMLQKMALIEEVQYFQMVFGYGKYVYDPTGYMSQHDIYKMVLMMDYADQYDYVANALESGELESYPDMEFMLYITGMEMGEDWTAEDEEMLMEAFAEKAPTPDKLREYAEKIRNFEVVEMTHEEVDAGLNAGCNEQFDCIRDWHQSMLDSKVECITEKREMAAYWTGKQLEWITKERTEVEAMFDAEHAMVEEKVAGLWECEYQYFSAPEGYRVMFEDMTMECKEMLMEQYEGIESWQLDGIIEEDMEEMPME